MENSRQEFRSALVFSPPAVKGRLVAVHVKLENTIGRVAELVLENCFPLHESGGQINELNIALVIINIELKAFLGKDRCIHTRISRILRLHGYFSNDN